MSGDRSVGPTPARARRAWAAGLRPDARWLVVGLGAIVTAWAVAGSADASGGSWIDLRQAGALDRALRSLATALVAVWLGALACVLVIGLLTRTLGPVSAAERRRLGPVPTPASPWSASLSTLAALTIFAIAAAGVVAGAARAVAASPAGLVHLWQLWLADALELGGLVVLAIGGLVFARDAWLGRQALFRTPEQVRHDARAEGTRRG